MVTVNWEFWSTLDPKRLPYDNTIQYGDNLSKPVGQEKSSSIKKTNQPLKEKSKVGVGYEISKLVVNSSICLESSQEDCVLVSYVLVGIMIDSYVR